MSNTNKQCVRQYQESKTLRFGLVPQGETMKWMTERGILVEDEERAVTAKRVQAEMDGFYGNLIETRFENAHYDWTEYVRLMSEARKKDDAAKKAFETARKQKAKELIAGLLSDDERKQFFGRKILDDILPKYISSREDISEEEKLAKLDDIDKFKNFFGYFLSFAENRKNVFSPEIKAGSIANRVLNENIVIFCDNMQRYEKLKGEAPEIVENVGKDDKVLGGWTLEQIFLSDFYNMVLCQKGIRFYNNITAHINSSLNLYCQQHDEVDKSLRKGAMMRSLKKQILVTDENEPDSLWKVSCDEEATAAIRAFGEKICERQIHSKTIDLCEWSRSEDAEAFLSNIFIRRRHTTDVSKALYEEWNVLDDVIKASLDTKKKGKKAKKSEGKEEYSLAELQSLQGDFQKEKYVKNITEYFAHVEAVAKLLPAVDELLNMECKNLKEDSKEAARLKTALDPYLDLFHALKVFEVGADTDKASEFYSEYDEILSTIAQVVNLYNKIRNYATAKPYSEEKYKLNFKFPTLANGWDRNKEVANGAVLFLKDGLYYLGIMNAKEKTKFVPCERREDVYEKMVYKLLPGPKKMLPKVFFSQKGIETFNPPKHILDGFKEKKYKKGEHFDQTFLWELIDWYKDALQRHPDWSSFGFVFTDTKSYQDIDAFYHDVEVQGYKITFENIKKEDVDTMVREGQLYLFQLYCKDFSKGSAGRDNLHTMYLKALFDEDNLKDVVFKLNGEAELFHRKASIRKPYVHQADSKLINKWTSETISRPIPDDVYQELDAYYNKGLEKLSDKAKEYLPVVRVTPAKYDIVKDKRYTEDKFFLHLPITINFGTPKEKNINPLVCKYLREADDVNFIGIDRGERNLLYVTVMDAKGHILKQRNFNVIEQKMLDETTQAERVKRYNYKDKLTQREKERDLARKDWATIGKITDLKEGYLSSVINEITDMMLEYNAVVVMEDLNYGFKRGRFKVERQVYQKFETMLINKLNYLVKKTYEKTAPGGVLRGLQLTNKVSTLADVGNQCGFIFYIPAGFTSKIDPTTGFVNVFDLADLTPLDKIRTFFYHFEDIHYNVSEDIFEFSFNYDNFKCHQPLFRKEWTVCSYGSRIRNYRDPENNYRWTSEVVPNLTAEFKKAFSEINYEDGSDIRPYLESLCSDKAKKLVSAFRLMLQLRNSIPNGEEDYILSPVRNAGGKFYDSRDYKTADGTGEFPENADANGSYNIALKGILLVDKIRKLAGENGEFDRKEFFIDNATWFEYMQTRKL